jgi:hypothetical protein
MSINDSSKAQWAYVAYLVTWILLSAVAYVAIIKVMQGA